MTDSKKRMKRVLLAFGAFAALASSAMARSDQVLDRAIELTSEQRYSEAREVLDSVLERRPDYSYARLLHGILRARAGRLAEAIEVFEQLRDDHPDMPEPYNNLAVLYAVHGRLDDARKILIAILERQPNAVAYANLGDVYAGLARRAYEHARELDPGREVPLDAGQDRNGSMSEVPSGSSIAFAMRAGPSDLGAGSQDEPATLRDADAESRDAAATLYGRALEPRDGVAGREGLPSDESDGSVKPLESDGVSTEFGTAALITETGMSAGELQAGVAGTVGSTAASSAAASEPSAHCARVSGFENRRAVAEAANWLQARGVEVMDVHDDRHEVATRHRVFLPPFTSRKEAYAKLREIRGRGVGDVAVIESGDLANGISFGVFARVENLHRRASALRALGYEVRTGAATVEVVNGFAIRARATSPLQDLESEWPPRFAEHPIQPVGCG